MAGVKRMETGATGSGTARQNLGLVIRGIIPGLPEIGKIKIGQKGQVITSKQGNKFQPPQKLDYFRVTTLARGKDGNFILDDAIHRRLGDRPKSLKVRLLYDDPELNFPTRLCCYNGAKLWCSGNNEMALRMVGQGPARQEVPCPCERIEPDFAGRGKCKYTGVLSVVLEDHQRVGGVWKFRTTSYNSVINIISSMAMIRQITGGKLAGIPLEMTVLPKTVPTPVTGQIQTVFVVGIEYRGSMLQLAEEGAKYAIAMAEQRDRIANVENYVKQQLITHEALDETPDDEIVDEFYPEQRKEETVEEHTLAKTKVEEKSLAPEGQSESDAGGVDLGGGLVEADTEKTEAEGSGPDEETTAETETGRSDQAAAAGGENKQELGAGMTEPQLWELFKNTMDSIGIRADESYAQACRFVDHNVRVAREPVGEVLRQAVNHRVGFVEALGKWLAAGGDKQKDKPGQEDPPTTARMNQAHNGPPDGVTIGGDIKAWGETHPFWPAMWDKRRAGDGVKTGLAGYINKNKHALANVPAKVVQDIKDKIHRVYKPEVAPAMVEGFFPPDPDPGQDESPGDDPGQGSADMSEAEFKVELRAMRGELVAIKQRDASTFNMAVLNMLRQNKTSTKVPGNMSLDEGNIVLEEIKELQQMRMDMNPNGDGKW